MTKSMTKKEAETALNFLIINAHKLLQKDLYNRNRLIKNVIIAVYYAFDDLNNKSSYQKIYYTTFKIINTLLEQSNLPLATYYELATVVDNS